MAYTFTLSFKLSFPPLYLWQGMIDGHQKCLIKLSNISLQQIPALLWPHDISELVESVQILIVMLDHKEILELFKTH